MAEIAEPCRAFWWMGQGFEHCDNCGRDIREHDGLHSHRGPIFGGEDYLMPFEEAMQRVPLFAHYATPVVTPARPYRWEPGLSGACGEGT